MMETEPNMKEKSDQELEEQIRAQHQYKLFQEALPKVDLVAFRMLLGEIVPLSMAIEQDLDAGSSSIDESDEDTSTETEAEEEEEEEEEETVTEGLRKLHIEETCYGPSHKLVAAISKAEGAQKQRVYARINQIGYQVGNKLSELLVFNNNPNLYFESMDLLAVMKFICRDVWKHLFGKQIDNLKTNHRGTFYLFDYEYQPIQELSLEGELSAAELEMVEPYMEFPCGVIRGVLASLGFEGEEQVGVSSVFVDIPKDRTLAPTHFPKGVNFNVQVASK